MKHRYFDAQGYTIAAIDSVLERGSFQDFLELVREIKNDPFGDASRNALAACQGNYVPGYSNLLASCVTVARGQNVSQAKEVRYDQELSFFP